MSLLQEFDIEIKDKSAMFNCVVDHLSRLKGKIDFSIVEQFPNEYLYISSALDNTLVC